MEKILNEILNRKIFEEQPIVLLHVGSNGSEFDLWKKISKSSILVAVDPEEQTLNSDFKKIIKVKNIISNKRGISYFNITKNTDCSSLLNPDKNVYSKWLISNRFKIKKKVKVKMITINDLLKEKKLQYIDWLVLDTQGMDLKILKSISKNILKKISVIDVEPTFFSFYKYESSLVDTLKFLNKEFEFNDMSFGKNYKVRSKELSSFDKIILKKYNKPSKIYSNLNYLNKMNKEDRQVLIKLIYLVLNKKYYEAKSILLKNPKLKNRKNIINYIDKKMNYFKLIFIFSIPFLILKKSFLTLKSSISKIFV